MDEILTTQTQIDKIQSSISYKIGNSEIQDKNLLDERILTIIEEEKANISIFPWNKSKGDNE